MGRVRSRKRRVRGWRFYRRMWSDCRRMWSDVVGLSSNRLSIGGGIQGVTAEIWSFQISWQAHYLVRLQGDFTCSTHWKWRFICDADQGWHSFCVAGAVFGDVGGWLYLLHALEMTFHMWRRSVMTFILRGRRSIWWCWRVTLLAPRIGNDVSYVTQISDDIHFAWQAQYLVKCESDFSWQAQRCRDILGDSRDAKCCILQYKIVSKMGTSKVSEAAGAEMTILSSDVVGCGRIIVESSFYLRKHSGSYRWNLELPDFVAGALFGEVAGWLYLLHALEMTFHMWRRSGMTFILRRQAQYLVMLEGDFTCSTHWKWRFICDADQWWHSFCVAGAVFGDVGGWLYLLHALEMTFHMSRRSVMTFILRGRRSIWMKLDSDSLLRSAL